MTNDYQRQLISRLFHAYGGPELSPEEFLQKWGASDGSKLGFDLLVDASQRRDSDDLEDAMAVCFTFGFGAAHFPVLIELSDAQWHSRHEDMITALDSYQSAEAVDAFKRATKWIPNYLDYDESRALAKKAIWALARMDNPKGWAALEKLTESADALVRDAATEKLEMRHH